MKQGELVLSHHNSFDKSFSLETRIIGDHLYANGEVVLLARAVHQKEYIGLVKDFDGRVCRPTLFFNEGSLGMVCNCGSANCCKHEYAMLCAVDGCKYDLIDFKPFERDGLPDIMKTVLNIPPAMLAAYVVANLQNRKNITPWQFVEDFDKFVPEYDYARYFNIAYNEILFKQYAEKYGLADEVYAQKNRGEKKHTVREMQKLGGLLKSIDKTLEEGKNREAFKIMSAVVDAAAKLGEDAADFANYKLAENMERCYHFANEGLETKMDKWAKKYRAGKYEHDKYLQRVVNF